MCVFFLLLFLNRHDKCTCIHVSANYTDNYNECTEVRLSVFASGIMTVNIPQLKSLTFLREDTELLLPFDDFLQLLKDNAHQSDKIIRKDNVKKFFSLKGEIRDLSGSTYVTFPGILLFVFNQRDNFKICKDTFDSVTNILTGKKETEPSTVIDLYKEIIKTKWNSYYGDIEINENTLKTLHSEYKAHFLKQEWKIICLFEFHFQKSSSQILSYEDQLLAKEKFLKKINKTAETAKSCSASAVSYMTEIQKRKNAAEVLNGPTFLQNGITHTYSGIVKTLMESKCKTDIELPKKANFSAVDCIPQTCSGHEFGVHVFADSEPYDKQTHENNAAIIRSEIQRHYKVFVPEVIFMNGPILESFSCSNCSEVHKFKLRDSCVTNQLTENIHYISKTEHSATNAFELRTDLDETDSSRYCKSCFSLVENELSRPLDWSNFSVLNEWYLEVPLELQIILTNLFINKASLKKSDDIKALISNKLFRLFSLLENGISILNKNFYGVIQQLNTEELIVNYHSVSTVFNITGQSSITRGQTFANEWLQRRADEDLVYFETFLKKYPLKYKLTSNQEAIQLVSMRDCLAVLYLDNLVRLRKHGDADRSSTKTSQLCTLPLTVKGLPRDSLLVSSWHLQDCQAADKQCSCLEVHKLSKADHNLLTECTEIETAVNMKFQIQALFGIGFFVTELRNLVTEHLTMQNSVIIDRLTQSDDINQPFLSISMNETLPLTIEDLERIAEMEREQSSDPESETWQSDMADKPGILSEVEELSQSFISISMNDELKETFEDKEQLAETEMQQLSDIESELGSDKSEQQIIHTEVEEINKSFTAILLNDELSQTAADVEMDPEHDENIHSIFSGEIAETEFIHGIGELEWSLPGSEAQEMEPIVSIPPSFDMEISETETTHTIQHEHEDFLISKFKVPPTLCRHPTPAKGRDDDINVLRDILLDILLKLGRYPGVVIKERILFAPDHKISKNLIQLMKTDAQFQQFLPEFPVLHLKKSKINNIFSAYSNARIVELLRYMKDSEQEDDWMDLITLRNIETAARNIKRLALGLHLAFLVRFICSLSDEDLEAIIEAIDTRDLAVMNQHWKQRFSDFLTAGIRANATFALHYDMMVHCDEILGISVAERMGGAEGYNLLLACVKSSLPFSFLNGATSYASFCVELLHCHYSAGPFHQKMKQCLFSTPHKDSEVNFALDTQREMDHQEALKGFRPRATLETVIPRMAVVDHFTQVQKTRRSLNKTDVSVTNSSVIEGAADQSSTTNQDDTAPTKKLNFEITEKDLTFILPLTRLILRSGGLGVNEDDTPRNIYNTTKPALSKSILDKESYSAGQFLVKKYACTQGLFQLTAEDIPSVTTVLGSSDILKKIKTTKGVTLRRATIKSKNITEEEMKETKRKALVKKKTKVIDCHSSDMNACQALVHPDCSKPSVQKSQAIKRALLKLLSLCLPSSDSVEDKLSKETLIMSGNKSFPLELRTSIAYATLEFAGVKFQTKATSGVQYLQSVEKGTIGRLVKDFPGLKRIVICEEKYSYTPDDFKSATRAQRQKSSGTSISHLKIATEILSDDKMTKSAIIHT